MSELEIEKPVRKKRSKASRNGFVFIANLVVSAAFLAVLFAGIAAYIGKGNFEEAGPLAETKLVAITSAENSVSKIAAKLHQAGIISNPTVFNVGVRAYQNTSKLKAGEYEFAAKSSMKDVMEKLVSGRSVQYFVTIPEGWTTYVAYQRVEANELLTGDMPLLVDEGELLPDTYSFQRGATRADVINRMVAAQDKFLDEVWAARDPNIPLKTKRELVILASLVEKETGPREEERGKVAQVFYNRINQGWRLETDPTILYGIYGGKGKPTKQGITKSEKAQRTPYNTYFIEGLPPGPITNPGKLALQAAANPTPTDAMFFVADGKGGHFFTKTLEEHSKYVAELRKREAEQAKKAAEDAKKEAEAAAQPSNCSRILAYEQKDPLHV